MMTCDCWFSTETFVERLPCVQAEGRLRICTNPSTQQMLIHACVLQAFR